MGLFKHRTLLIVICKNSCIAIDECLTICILHLSSHIVLFEVLVSLSSLNYVEPASSELRTQLSLVNLKLRPQVSLKFVSFEIVSA